MEREEGEGLLGAPTCVSQHVFGGGGGGGGHGEYSTGSQANFYIHKMLLVVSV